MKPDESAIAYTKELLKRIEASMRAVIKADVLADITKEERNFYPVLREIQLVVPRIGNEYLQCTNKRRNEIKESI